jgi:hypothetical protein
MEIAHLIPSEFSLLQRAYGPARALNEFYERHGCLPSGLADSEYASEACGLSGLLPVVSNLLRHCS